MRIFPFLLFSLSFCLFCIAPGCAPDALENNFKAPPASAKPFTWWHWMNGNISKEGITADLEAMATAGVGGVQVFNIGILQPGPVGYASPEWFDLTNHAIRECQRLGLEFDMHNCPGWSSTGGFWITPEQAGKQISWSEAFVRGGKVVDMILPSPKSALDCYWDEVLLAWPSTKDEAIVENYLVRSTIDGSDVPPGDISMNTGKEYRFNKEVYLEFSQSVTAQTLRGVISNEMPPMSPEDLHQVQEGFGGPQIGEAPRLKFSTDGKTWTDPVDITIYLGSLSYASFPSTSFRYAKIEAGEGATVVLEGLQLSGAPMDDGFLKKSNYEMRAAGNFGSMGFGRDTAPAPLKEVPAEYAIDPTKVLDISEYMDEDGHLVWDAPEGDWTVLRVGYVPIDRHTKSSSTVGDGLEIDKYSKEALQFHWDWLYPRLMEELEKSASANGTGMLIDSYECGNSNWTPKMRDEFKNRRGYEMTPYLPALVGKYVANSDVSERFLWDFRRTCADLFADNYAGYFADLLHKHNFLLYNEPYNSSVFDEMQLGSRADIPMGEFWMRTHQDRQTLKMASSISHVNGKRLENGSQIVGAESFSGWQADAAWQNFPYSLKAQGDDAWTMGLNRFIFHRFTHQPNVNVAPGMTMGNIGFHFDRTNTWFEMGSQWLKYVARSQYLLQQGDIVADVLYLVSEDVPGGSHSAWDPDIPYGYWGDQANAEMFLNSVKLDGASLLSADGAVRYRVLILQEVNGGRKMTLPVLRKIHKYVSKGGILCGSAPTTTPNLSSEDELSEFKSLVSKIWSSSQVFAAGNVQDALNAAGIVPDVEYSFEEDAPVNYIHRHFKGTEIYFLANHRRTPENLTVTFRCNGKRPELWNADNGDIIKMDTYEVLPDGRVRVPIYFDPVGSWFVVFRDKAGKGQISISRDGQTIVSAKPYPQREGGLYNDVRNNFTISMWLRPEANSNIPSSGGARYRTSAGSTPYALGNAEQLYGAGHAVAGILATRSGVVIMERSGGEANAVLASTEKISSWTHVAAVYRDGVPSLYVNGELKNVGQSSGNIVHPTYKDIPVTNNNLSFEGDFNDYTVIDRPLSEAEIKAEVAKGSPKAPAFFPAVLQSKDGWYVFENGNYTLGEKSFEVSGLDASKDLTASGWTLSFPSESGAPAQIILGELMPLQNHPDDGVKHFSGTITYKTTFTLGDADLGNDAYFLDLGQVYVIARAKLNGKDLGVLWKAPYRVEVTNLLKVGSNELEIEVANLWTNRLIGDSRAPIVYPRAGMDKTSVPDWYLRGEPKPEDGRVVFTVSYLFEGNEPLYDSGLVGPVIIRPASQIK